MSDPRSENDLLLEMARRRLATLRRPMNMTSGQEITARSARGLVRRGLARWVRPGTILGITSEGRRVAASLPDPSS